MRSLPESRCSCWTRRHGSPRSAGDAEPVGLSCGHHPVGRAVGMADAPVGGEVRGIGGGMAVMDRTDIRPSGLDVGGYTVVAAPQEDDPRGREARETPQRTTDGSRKQPATQGRRSCAWCPWSRRPQSPRARSFGRGSVSTRIHDSGSMAGRSSPTPRPATTRTRSRSFPGEEESARRSYGPSRMTRRRSRSSLSGSIPCSERRTAQTRVR